MHHLRAVLTLAATSVAAAGCMNERPPEFGVSVFAADTVPATFTVAVAGSLVMGLRSEVFHMRPDKSLMMTTPAELIIQNGDGEATISSLSGGRLVVQPFGVNPDSGDTSSAQGLSVKFTRGAQQRNLKLTVEKK